MPRRKLVSQKAGRDSQAFGESFASARSRPRISPTMTVETASFSVVASPWAES